MLYSIHPTITHTVRDRSRSRTPPIPTSDPIQTSSPKEESPVHSRRTCNTTSQEVSFVSTGLLGGPGITLNEEDSSDDDLPDFADLNEQDSEKKRKELALKELKNRVTRQPRQWTDEYDSGSDIEIVDDQKTVARDVAQTRRGMLARGEFPTKGAKRQLEAAGAGARRDSAIVAPIDVDNALKAAAAPSFLASSKSRTKTNLTTASLNRMLLDKSRLKGQEEVRRKEEEWQRRGGKLKEQPSEHAPGTVSLDLQQVLEKHRATLEKKQVDVEMVQDSDSDEDWEPEGEQRMDNIAEGSDREVQESSRQDADDQADDEGDGEDDDENPFIVKRPSAVRPPRVRPVAVVDSDDEVDTENQPPPTRSRMLVRDTSFARDTLGVEVEPTHLLSHRDSVSSLGDNTDGTRTEDGTDKENDVRLSFDRGEDKENTAVAAQSPMSAISMRLGRSFGSLFAAEIQASPSSSVGHRAPDDVRSPLKELPAEDDDPFAFTPGPPLQLGGPGGGHCSLEASPTLDLGASPALDLGAAPSLNLGGGSGLAPAFSLSLSANGKGKDRARSASPSPLGEPLELGGGLGGGGFSQFFTQEGVSGLKP